MPSQIEIWNRALSRIGARRITDPTEDSQAAAACTAAWEFVRDEVLRSHPWNCATTRAELAAESGTPAFDYAYAYNLPADCLRVLRVETWTEWVIEGRQILTDSTAPLQIVYVRREEDTEKYDAGLASAMAARMAAEVAEELSKHRMEDMLFIYDAILRRAQRLDGMENPPVEFDEDEWISVRY